MSDRYNDNYTDDYTDSFDNFLENDEKLYRKRPVRKNKSKCAKGRGRKGLKWKLIALTENKYIRIAIPCAIGLLILILLISAISSCGKKEEVPAATEPVTTQAVTEATAHQIDGVPVIVQSELKAACETYACTMLLQSYGFDIDEYAFVDNYLVTKPVYYGVDGNMYGPDMNSAYAGDVYTGYGINAPGMAKCMNTFLNTTDTKLKAYPIVGESLKDLCKEYILNDVPVMVWATTFMEEPYVHASWIVDYVDENAAHKVGDTVEWQMHEHCMVLTGFDEENYYFSDSVAGKVSAFDIATTEDRYEKIGKQAIVLK